MSKFDQQLSDPRSHRAVPDPEMSGRVATRALAQFRQEQGAAPLVRAESATGRKVTRTQAAILLMRWMRTPRKARVALVCALVAAAMVAWVWQLMQAGALPRYDLYLKYGSRDLAFAMATRVQHAPLLTSAFLAAAACTIGFALSSRARTGASAYLRV